MATKNRQTFDSCLFTVRIVGGLGSLTLIHDDKEHMVVIGRDEAEAAFERVRQFAQYELESVIDPLLIRED